MNIAIDPDVFKASFHDFQCIVGINTIGLDFKSHRFFRDEQETLEKEYCQIFNEYFENNIEQPSIRLLEHILLEDGNLKDRISHHCSANQRDQFLNLGCSQPVEPVLLGMMANARDIGLVLGMLGNDTEHTRPRGLHNECIRWRVHNIIPWLDIKWIGKPEITIPESDSSRESNRVIRAKADAFESKAALYLQDQDTSLRCITPPKRGNIGNEQIDIYGYRTADDGAKIVVVGECKLRRCGNEDRSIDVGEVQQLRRKVIAARDYETKKNKGRNLTHAFEGVLITNATGLDESAIHFVQSETAFQIRILHVTLPRDWETSDEWCIVQSEWLKV